MVNARPATGQSRTLFPVDGDERGSCCLCVAGFSIQMQMQHNHRYSEAGVRHVNVFLML